MMLDTWPTLSACHQELLYGVTRRELSFDPYRGEDEKATDNAIEREKLVTCALRGMKPEVARDENAQSGTIKDIMSGWFYGISVLEIIWQLVDLKDHGASWIPKATYWVDPSQYAFSQDGELGLVENSAPTGYGTTSTSRPTTIVRRFPPNKFLVCVHKSRSGNPLGGSMLRPLAWWWCAANFSSDWLLNLAQVFGLPFRWANFAASSPDETVSQICSMLQNMGSSGWAAFPEGTTLELKEAHTASTGHTPQGDLLDRADHYARTLILGQTMTGQTIASGRGGQAFGTVEAQLKQDRLDAACLYVSEIFNQQLIPYILTLNYGETDEPPSCKFFKETEGTYQDAQRDQILMNMGVPIPFSHLQQKYNIPEPTGGEPVTEKMIPPSPLGGGGPMAGPKGTRPIGQTADATKKKAEGKEPAKQQVAARLAEIQEIEDPEVFGSEFKRLAVDLVTGKEP